MQLFTVGPVMMFPETLEESGKQLPYFRTDEFSSMMLDSERLLKDLLRTSQDSKVAFLTASGTGAMEAAVSNLFEPKDRVLIINGGGFGRRFEEICDVHSIPYDSVKLEFGERLTRERLYAFSDNDYAALLVNIDETSTGQLYDKRMLSEFCRSKGMYLVVDAISSFLADDIRMDEDGIDVVIISSQKALSLAPGISLVVMNGGIYRDRAERIPSPGYYLDLKRHVVNQERGQTPFTPAVGILINLNAMLHRIAEVGVDAKVARTAELSRYFREKAEAIGLRIPDYPLSNAVTPLVFDSGARAIYEKLRDEYQITVTPSGGDLYDRVLRVGHIGNLDESDYDKLIEAFREVMG